MKTTKGETKKTIQNEGCTQLWRNNSTYFPQYPALASGELLPCPNSRVSLNSPRLLIIRESLGSMHTKSTGYWNAPPKTPRSMQPQAFQNRREPIRITPQHMHAWNQVKTIFLHESSSCLPAKPSPAEHILVRERRARHAINKKKKQDQIKQGTRWTRFISCMAGFSLRDKDSK